MLSSGIQGGMQHLAKFDVGWVRRWEELA